MAFYHTQFKVNRSKLAKSRPKNHGEILASEVIRRIKDRRVIKLTKIESIGRDLLAKLND